MVLQLRVDAIRRSAPYSGVRFLSSFERSFDWNAGFIKRERNKGPWSFMNSAGLLCVFPPSVFFRLSFKVHDIARCTSSSGLYVCVLHNIVLTMKFPVSIAWQTAANCRNTYRYATCSFLRSRAKHFKKLKKKKKRCKTAFPVSRMFYIQIRVHFSKNK